MHEENSNESASSQKTQINRSKTVNKTQTTTSQHSRVIENQKKNDTFVWFTAISDDSNFSDILKILLVSIVEPIDSKERHLIKVEWQDVMAAISKAKTEKINRYCTELMKDYREWHKSSESNIPKHILEKIRFSFRFSPDEFQQIISTLKKMSIDERSSVRSILYHKLKGMTDFFNKNQSELSRRAIITQNLNTAQKEKEKLNDELKVLKANIQHLNIVKKENAKLNEELKVLEANNIQRSNNIQKENVKLNEELKVNIQRFNTVEKVNAKLNDELRELKAKIISQADLLDKSEFEKQKISTELNAKFESEKQKLTDDYRATLQNHQSQYKTELQQSRERIQNLEEERKTTLSTLKELQSEDSLNKKLIDTLTHETEAAKQEASRLLGSVNDLRSKYEIELQESRERIQNLEEERKTTLSTLKELQSEDSLNKKLIDTLTHETEAAKQEASRLLGSVNDLRSKYEIELQESRGRINKLEEERKNTLTILKELRHEDALNKTKIDTLTHETKVAKQEASRLQSALDDVKTLLSKYEADLDESCGRILKLEEEKRNTLPTLIELRHEVLLNKTEIDTLTCEYKSAKQKASRLQSTLNIHEIEIQELHEKIQELEEEHRETLSRLNDFQQEDSLKQTKIDCLTHEIQSAKNEASQLQLILDELESEKQKIIDNYQEDVRLYDLQVKNLETKLQESEEEQKSILSTLNDLQHEALQVKNLETKLQESEEEQKSILSTLNDLQHEASLKQAQIDTLTRETKSAKQEASRLQSALGDVRDLQWNNDDASNPLQITKDIDRIRGLLNDVTKVKPKTQIHINESTSQALLKRFKIQNYQEERTYKIALSNALQRTIIDKVFNAISSTINNPNSIRDGNLETHICYHLNKLVFFMNTLAANRSGDDEITIIAPIKIRQQVFASLGSRGYNRSGHSTIDLFANELVKDLDKYRKVLSEELKKNLLNQVVEVIIELMHLHFRLYAQDPIPEIRWIDNEADICGGFMEGPWDIEDSQNSVVDFCYFPAIGIDLDDDKNRRVYCKAQVSVRPKKKNKGVLGWCGSHLLKSIEFYADSKRALLVRSSAFAALLMYHLILDLSIGNYDAE
ncbi:13878_t:CDS:2 [Ambispora leptoticha]|uniref:13878_t:CDS:1 n=1 Tax=Ambispora leptoticha TaxID=144679 RepID=A0A9N8ZUE0_9GLOM|nr:13878_t:CDS:2 [Ambispora leptoticha]